MSKRGQIGGGMAWFTPGLGKRVKHRYYKRRRQMLRLEARTGRENVERGLPGAVSEMKRKAGDGWKP